MSFFIEQALIGLTLGALYALLAMGLSLVVAVARLINFAHGEFFMLGGYAFWFLYKQMHLTYTAALAGTVAAVGIFGVLYERIVVRPLLDRSWRVQLIGTLAASIVIVNAAILFFGNIPREAATRYALNVRTLGGAPVAEQRLLIVVFAGATVLVFHWFIQKTRVGKAIRAMAQNREACQAFGIDVHHMAMITLGLSGALAGLASALIVPLYPVAPTMGTVLTFKSLAAVILGGLGKVYGALVAALILGFSEAYAIYFVSSEYADAFVFGVMIFTLLLRPLGLFGRKVGI